MYHIQADHTLTYGEKLTGIQRSVDNIHLGDNGEVVIAAIPKLLQFTGRAEKGEGASAAQVWVVRNETSDQR